METKAILRVDGFNNENVDLYLPEDVWSELRKKFKSNKLTVIIRMIHEYTGVIKIEP